MTAAVVTLDAARRLETLHDRYIAAARRFRDAPTRHHADEAADAYAAFYVAYAGQDGLADALADICNRMAREIGAGRRVG